MQSSSFMLFQKSRSSSSNQVSYLQSLPSFLQSSVSRQVSYLFILLVNHPCTYCLAPNRRVLSIHHEDHRPFGRRMSPRFGVGTTSDRVSRPATIEESRCGPADQWRAGNRGPIDPEAGDFRLYGSNSSIQYSAETMSQSSQGPEKRSLSNSQWK